MLIWCDSKFEGHEKAAYIKDIGLILRSHSTAARWRCYLVADMARHDSARASARQLVLYSNRAVRAGHVGMAEK